VVDDGQHAAFVGGWLGRAGKDLTPELLLRLFDKALAALWARSKTTLGEVTLTAIADRVLCNATEKFPVLYALRVEETTGIQCRELQSKSGATLSPEVITGLQFVLVEFLTVLGHLTAEILTPDLRAGLSSVALPDAVRAESGDGS
jgi:hypothetical protein